MRNAAWVFALSLLAACASLQEPAPENASRYDLNRPTGFMNLPDSLAEVSGIAWIAEGELAMVQDEALAVYRVSLASRVISAWHLTGKFTDNEGITIRRNEPWVVNSEGSVFHFGQDTLEMFRSGLSKSNDIEGIAWDELNHRFLLACKGHPGIYPAEDKRSIYAFDTSFHPISKDPALKISGAEIAAFEPAKTAKERLNNRKGGSGKSEKAALRQLFQPSDMAIHPIFGTYFILSADSGLLVECSVEGRILDVWSLPKKTLPKAEGITFAPDGTMYIATERGCRKCSPGLGTYKLKQLPKRPQ